MSPENMSPMIKGSLEGRVFCTLIIQGILHMSGDLFSSAVPPGVPGREERWCWLLNLLEGDLGRPSCLVCVWLTLISEFWWNSLINMPKAGRLNLGCSLNAELTDLYFLGISQTLSDNKNVTGPQYIAFNHNITVTEAGLNVLLWQTLLWQWAQFGGVVTDPAMTVGTVWWRCDRPCYDSWHSLVALWQTLLWQWAQFGGVVTDPAMTVGTVWWRPEENILKSCAFVGNCDPRKGQRYTLLLDGGLIKGWGSKDSWLLIVCHD